MSTPDNLLYLRAIRFVEIGNFFASSKFSGRSVISVSDGDDPRFEAVEQKSENISDLLIGLQLDSSDSESDLVVDQVSLLIQQLLLIFVVLKVENFCPNFNTRI
jgi:hypothetical protein